MILFGLKAKQIIEFGYDKKYNSDVINPCDLTVNTVFGTQTFL